VKRAKKKLPPARKTNQLPAEVRYQQDMLAALQQADIVGAIRAHFCGTAFDVADEFGRTLRYLETPPTEAELAAARLLGVKVNDAIMRKYREAVRQLRPVDHDEDIDRLVELRAARFVLLGQPS
jgi:hypothetical protein